MIWGRRRATWINFAHAAFLVYFLTSPIASGWFALWWYISHMVLFRLLINASGSGKSRILLEGLCRHWGFYFVVTGSSIVGSSDFYATFSTINLKSTDAFSYPTERRLLQLLLARLLLLNLFIEVANCSRTGLQQKEHRRLWTLLQVQHKGSF